MQTPTRRRFLGGMTTVAAVAIAGCLGDDAEVDADSFASWIPASLLEDATRSTVMVVDAQSLRTTWPEAVVDQFDFDVLATQFGIEADVVDAYLLVHSNSETAPGSHVVLFGSFDQDAVLETIDPDGDVDTHAGFETVDGLAYVGDDAIVDSSAATAMLDASTGDESLLIGSDDTIEEAFDAHGDGPYTVFLIDDDAPHIIEGITMDVDGDAFITEARSYFESTDAAEEAADAVEEQLRMEIGVDDFDNVEQDGSVLVFAVSRDVDDVF